MARREDRQNRNRFARRVNRFLKSTNAAEKSTLRGAWEIIRQAQAILLERLSLASGWEVDNLKELRQAIDDTTESTKNRLADYLHGEAAKYWEQGIEATVEPVSETLNIHVSKGNIDTRMLQVLNVNTSDLVTQIMERTRQKIHNEVNLAVMGVQRPQDALRSVKTLLAGDPKRQGTGLTWQAERIVRTEMNRAHSIASFEAMKEVERIVPEATKEWIAQTDGRERHSHHELNGMKVPVSQPFKHSSIKTPGGLMYPRDPRGLPSDVINCRCRVVISRDIVEKAFDNSQV